MKKFLYLLPVLLLNGCFLGTFRTAEPIGAGNIEKNFYFNFPLYYSDDYKNDARNAGSFYARPNFGAILTFGASDYMDFALKYDFAYGIGTSMMFRFFHREPLSVSLSGGFGYNFFAQGFTWNMDLLTSARLSPFASLYLGILINHLPDYRGITEGGDLLKVRKFTNYYGFGLGISLKNLSSGYFIKGFGTDIIIPVEKYPPFVWGFSLYF